MPEREFWGLTLAQFYSLAKEYGNEQEMLNYRGAMICSVIAEVNRDRKKRKRPFTPADFMPKKKRREMTDEQMLEQIMEVNAELGGETE